MTAKPQDVSLNVVGQSIVSTMNLGATKADIKRLMENISEIKESVYRHARQSRLPKNFPLAA
jgi:hypothetical protein